MAKVQHTVTGCVPIDKSILEAYVALVNTTESADNHEAARVAAESGRVAAESTRVNSENTRISNENTRVSNENTRQGNESGRVSAESTRVSSESTRVANENTRIESENTRKSNETTRQSNESGRVSAESTRVSNENTRKSNEVTRQENEASRQQGETNRNTQYAIAEGTSAGSVAGDGSRWGSYKTAEAARGTAADTAEGTSSSVAGDGSRWGAYKTAEASRDTAYAGQEGTSSASAGDANRWGAYKTAEAARDTARANAEGTASSTAGDGTRWGAYKTAEAARTTTYEGVEGTNAGSTAGDGTRWGTFKTNEAARDAEVAEAISSITGKADKTYVDENFAKKNGYYSTLTSGAAENLVGRGSVAASYTRRTSGGTDDIGSGSALITKLKGKTIVWNQLGDVIESFANASVLINGNYITVTSVDSSSVMQIYYDLQPLIKGHKYLFVTSQDATKTNGCVMAIMEAYSAVVAARPSANTIYTHSSDGSAFHVIYQYDRTSTSSQTSFTIPKPTYFDLTLMFGAGNEPDTVAEFEALFPLPYYAYDAGTLKSVTATGIETVGFNQWDEEWEEGNLDGAGEPISSDNSFRSKNFCKMFPNTGYYLRRPSGDVATTVYMYDANYNFIEYKYTESFVSSENAAYFKIARYSAGATYNHDICINLSWSGIRNGEYEPYWASTLNLPITTLQGKLNGEGSAVTIFPNGLRSAGSAYDEIVGNKAIKRVGAVDLGTLEWDWASNCDSMSAVLTGAKMPDDYDSSPNALCAKYEPTAWADLANNYATITNKYCFVASFIRVRDAQYTSSDVAAFKTAMSGVMLYYELATYEEYELEEELNLNYRVDDFGTEERLPADTASAVSAPISYDVQYAMNAVDTLRRLPVNYDTTGGIDALCSALATALSSALNGTFTITRGSYNAETEKYAFNVSFTPASEITEG